MLDNRLIVAQGWERDVGWIVTVDWLHSVCWTWVWGLLHWALCLAFPPASFCRRFPSLFLFVVGENCGSMQSKAFSVKWPVFKCSGGRLVELLKQIAVDMKMWGAVSIQTGGYTLGEVLALPGCWVADLAEVMTQTSELNPEHGGQDKCKCLEEFHSNFSSRIILKWFKLSIGVFWPKEG